MIDYSWFKLKLGKFLESIERSETDKYSKNLYKKYLKTHKSNKEKVKLTVEPLTIKPSKGWQGSSKFLCPHKI